MRVTSLVGMLLLGLIAVASFFAQPTQSVAAASAPGAPGTPVAIPGEAAATVYWGAASGTVTSYQVVASPGGAGTTVSGSTLSGTVPGLTDTSPYTFTVTASNSGTPGPASSPSNSVVPGMGAFTAVTPMRILDTRGASALGPGGVITLAVDGKGGLPSGGMNAVILNVTVTNTTATSWLTVWPAGIPRPRASNLNWTAGRTMPNLAEVALGVGDQISIANAAGNADVLVDVQGYVATPSAFAAPGGFNPLVPSRVLDTRNGLGAPKAQLCAGQTITVQIAGRGGVPSSGVSAVIMNVTATRTVVAPSWVIVWPTGAPRPNVSNLNFVPGQVVANRVVVPLGAGGAVSFYDAAGHTDVVADVNGWFTTAAGSGAKFVGLPPTRILDSRSNPVAWPGRTSRVILGNSGGVPWGTIVSASAVVLNVTVTNPTSAGWLTVWPDGAARPNTSDLNFVAGQTVANLVVVQLGTGGAIDLYVNAGRTDVIIDVVGWYG